MRIWIVFDGLLDHDSSKIIGVYGNGGAADAHRAALMTRIEGLPPWDNAFIEEHEVIDSFDLARIGQASSGMVGCGLAAKL